MTVHESVLDAIGGTPLLRLQKLGAGVRPRIYAKLEFQNIGGSVKDRAALSMIRAAEEAGLLKPGGTVVEGTSGNTGIGLSLVAAQLGYRSVIFAPAATAAEKIRLLKAFGAEVHLVADFVPRSDPGHLANRAAAFAASTPGAWLALQYDNPANPDAHFVGTGPEIWADTSGSVTHFVASVGTGGTISGTGRFLKQASDGAVQVIAADPEHSRYGGGNGSLKYTEGAGHPLHPASVEDIWPEAFDNALVDKYFSITDRDAIFTARRAAREEGLLIGATGGTALAAALQLAETLDENHTIVVVLPDSGRNYLSTYFDDDWLTSLGFLEPTTPSGTVRSLLTRAPSGVQLLASGLTAAEAAVELYARGLAPGEPAFLVLDRGESFGTVHPREVVAVVTLESLSAVDDAASADTAGLAYSVLGAGLPVPAQAGADGGTGGEIIAVLVDGRIAATLP
ncbi:PLP-dependent cysteine synthase family protein [Paenarthrobacter nicotinovorans]|uniref:PLP-dependent cysteine synthase family protein n=1 Tax=Paenarthrobacter nicotinovorans TaxID=29320 RepID=UPI0011A5CCA9|nr:cysteine synthase family protein [Paenarthrobacter nicotinovorans]